MLSIRFTDLRIISFSFLKEEISDSDIDAPARDEVTTEHFPESFDVTFKRDEVVLCTEIISINKGLDLIRVSPIHRKKVSQESYRMKKHIRRIN